jgi:hypothetical protein
MHAPFPLADSFEDALITQAVQKIHRGQVGCGYFAAILSVADETISAVEGFAIRRYWSFCSQLQMGDDSPDLVVSQRATLRHAEGGHPTMTLSS